MENTDDHDSLLNEISLKDDEAMIPTRKRSRYSWSSLCASFPYPYILNIVLLVLLLLSINRTSDPSLGTYSPANDVVEYETKVFLDNVVHLSPFQGEPNDEKDALWDDAYGKGGLTLIDAASAAKLPNQTAEVPGTDEKHLISLEVFHQLHCLNVIRKGDYPERYPEFRLWRSDGTKDPDAQMHRDHCIDRIRQELMCSSNVGTVFWSWREDKQMWWIDMQTTHTCRNFDKIKEWAFERNIPRAQMPPSIYSG